MISVCVSGRRHSYQPLAYSALKSLFSETIRLSEDPNSAQIVLFAHPDDLIDAAIGLVPLIRAHPEKRVVYLSEEPYWDTVGPFPPFDRHREIETAAGPLPITCLTHHTSAIFAFEQIPYFLLTEPSFAERYAQRFAVNRQMSAEAWQAHFARAPLRAVFMAENRLSPGLDVSFPDHDVRGLCPYRTELALRYRTGPVLRAGRGWATGSQNRITLPDWHLNKLSQLDRHCVFVSAIENTHQKSYVSEKIFDAFAIGAVPLYYGAADHAVHRIAAAGSWLNLYGLSPEDAATAIDAFCFDAAFLDRYITAQTELADLFARPNVIAQERRRLQRALLGELNRTLTEDQPPPGSPGPTIRICP